jgi:hypothetical protein
MSKKKTPTSIQDGEVQWNDDDFNLDSHGVEAPEKEVFELFAEMGYKPEDVNEVVRARYVKYLNKMNKKQEKP